MKTVFRIPYSVFCIPYSVFQGLPKCAAFLILLAFLSCQKDATISTITNETKSELTPSKTLDYIRKLGYSDSVIKEHGDSYLVEGCIMFKKDKDYDTNWRDKTQPQSLQTRQYGTSSYIAFNLQPSITVGINSNDADFIAAVTIVVNRYNNLNSR